jgi:hypothetical protein
MDTLETGTEKSGIRCLVVFVRHFHVSHEIRLESAFDEHSFRMERIDPKRNWGRVSRDIIQETLTVSGRSFSEKRESNNHSMLRVPVVPLNRWYCLWQKNRWLKRGSSRTILHAILSWSSWSRVQRSKDRMTSCKIRRTHVDGFLGNKKMWRNLFSRVCEGFHWISTVFSYSMFLHWRGYSLSSLFLSWSFHRRNLFVTISLSLSFKLFVILSFQKFFTASSFLWLSSLSSSSRDVSHEFCVHAYSSVENDLPIILSSFFE